MTAGHKKSAMRKVLTGEESDERMFYSKKVLFSKIDLKREREKQREMTLMD